MKILILLRKRDRIKWSLPNLNPKRGIFENFDTFEAKEIGLNGHYKI